MKKLLTILGALSLTASTSALIVSCSKDEDDTKYGGTFIDGDGNLKINATTLLDWYNSVYGSLGKNPNKYVTEFYNIFAVSVFEDITQDSNKSILASKLDSDTVNELKKAWGSENDPGSIKSQAALELKNARQVYLDDKNKKLKGWLKYLRGQYPTVSDNQEALENAWTANFILTSDKYGAYKTLTRILAIDGISSTTKWVKGTKTYKLTTTEGTQHQALLTAFKEKFNNLKISEATGNILETKNITPDQELSIINLINSIGGRNALADKVNSSDRYKLEWVNSLEGITWENLFNSISDRYSTLTETEKNENISSNISNFLTSTDMDLKFQSGLNYDTYFSDYQNYNGLKIDNLRKIVNFIPVYESKDKSFTSVASTQDSRVGILTNSQRFLSNKYFAENKPVAVSDIVLKFNRESSPDTDKEISFAEFIKTDDETNTIANYLKGFNEFYNNYVANKNDEPDPQTGLTHFEALYRGASKSININGDSTWASTYLSTKNNSTLLTVDDSSYSNVAKYAIYDFVANNGNNAFELSDGEGAKIADLSTSNTNITEAFWSDFNSKVIDDSNKESQSGAIALYNLVKATDRHVSDSKEESTSTKVPVYTVVNENLGIIAYIDTDGLHFTKIDGWQYINPSKTKNSSSKENDVKDSRALESLAYDSIFSNSSYSQYLINSGISNSASESTTQESESTTPYWDNKNQEIINNLSNMVGLNNFKGAINYSIANDYERFLVNSSIVKNINSSNSLYDFDYLTSLTSSLSNSDGTFKDLGQWLWKYLKEVLNTTDSGLFNNFFYSTNEDNNDIDENAVKELIQQIQTIDKKNYATKIGTFDSNNASWAEKVEESSSKNKLDLNNDLQAQSFIPNKTIETTYLETFDSETSNNFWGSIIESYTKTNSLNLVYNYDKVIVYLKEEK